MIYDFANNLLFVKNGRAASSTIEEAWKTLLDPVVDIATPNLDDEIMPKYPGFNYIQRIDGQREWHLIDHDSVRLIHRLLPVSRTATLVVSVRDPIEKAKSWYRWYRKIYDISASFESFVHQMPLKDVLSGKEPEIVIRYENFKTEFNHKIAERYYSRNVTFPEVIHSSAAYADEQIDITPASIETIKRRCSYEYSLYY